MPLPPRPMTFECPHCHWQRSYASPSDVLCLPPWAQQCPRCGHRPLQCRRANALAALRAKLFPFAG